MIYILSGLTGLLILVALFTFIHKRRHSEDPETIVAPPADCCGAHAICEKGLKKASPQIDYFDDEELDVYRQIAPEAYTDEQIERACISVGADEMIKKLPKKHLSKAVLGARCQP